MIITNCPKCGSMNITTAGVCSYCGWSQFNKSMVSTDVLLDVATPIDVALRKRIAELEGKIDQLTAHSDIKRQDDKSSNDTQTQTIVYGKEDSEMQE